jgi:hypothetical protein
MIAAGDRVRIGETREIGTVTEVHPHEVLVRVRTATGSEVRRLAHGSVRLEPTIYEATGFIDH